MSTRKNQAGEYEVALSSGYRPVEPEVVSAIQNAFRNHEQILADLRWHEGDCNYSFQLHGIHVGVELPDANGQVYIHS